MEEEESFKARVDRVFGSLPIPQPLNNDALWSLTDDEIQKREWNRHKDSPPPDDDLSGPFAARPLSNCRSKKLLPDDGDGDDVDDEDGDDAEPSFRMCAKPDDHDDEWIIRSSIGMDCTLDKEEEEDEFDKLAVGREKKGERIYMNEVIDYTTYADTFYELPTSVGEICRDPRANRLAAELRLKEDAQAVSELNENQIVVVGSSCIQNGLPVDRVNVRSILKKDEKKAEPKSLKRVRFDPEIDCNLKKQDTGSDKESRDSLHPPRSDCRVPDYLRNPSKYTQYTFDSTNDLDGGKANKKAFLDFFDLIRQKRAGESQSAEHVGESLDTVTFVPRNKSNKDSVEQGDESKKRSIHKEYIVCKGTSPVIAAADEACAMEEDDKPEMTPVCHTIPRKAQRQYRARATLEPPDE